MQIDTSLKFHRHIASATRKAAGVANNILSSTVCRSPMFMKFIFSTYVRPILEFGSPVWNTGYQGDLRLLERVQRMWTKQVHGLENLPYSERLAALNLFSVKGRLLRADLILMWKIFHGISSITPQDLFSMEVRPGNRGHRFKIRKLFAGSEQRSRFFSYRHIDLWNSLPSEVVSAASITTFKRKLHLSLGERLFAYVD